MLQSLVLSALSVSTGYMKLIIVATLCNQIGTFIYGDYSIAKRNSNVLVSTSANIYPSKFTRSYFDHVLLRLTSSNAIFSYFPLKTFSILFLNVILIAVIEGIILPYFRCSLMRRLSERCMADASMGSTSNYCFQHDYSAEASLMMVVLRNLILASIAIGVAIAGLPWAPFPYGAALAGMLCWQQRPLRDLFNGGRSDSAEPRLSVDPSMRSEPSRSM